MILAHRIKRPVSCIGIAIGYLSSLHADGAWAVALLLYDMPSLVWEMLLLSRPDMNVCSLSICMSIQVFGFQIVFHFWVVVVHDLKI